MIPFVSTSDYPRPGRGSSAEHGRCFLMCFIRCNAFNRRNGRNAMVTELLRLQGATLLQSSAIVGPVNAMTLVDDHDSYHRWQKRRLFFASLPQFSTQMRRP